MIEVFNELVEWYKTNGSLQMLIDILMPVLILVGSYFAKKINVAQVESRLISKKVITDENKFMEKTNELIKALTEKEKQVAQEKSQLAADMELLTTMILGVIENSKIPSEKKTKYILMANKMATGKVDVDVKEVESKKVIEIEKSTGDIEKIEEPIIEELVPVEETNNDAIIKKMLQ